MEKARGRMLLSLIPPAVAMGLGGCAPTEGACSTSFAATGPLAVDFSTQTLECSGLSDNLETTVLMDWRSGTTILSVEFVDLAAGDTGERTAIFGVDDRGDQWTGRCPMTIREHTHVGGSIWQVRADVRCDPLAADFDNRRTDPLALANGGAFTFEGWHSRYEY